MGCTLCPVKCGAEREQRAGRCGVKGMTVAKYYLHPYEEPPICHTNGAGAVFFGGCSLRCVFCQNFEVSRAARGKAVSAEGLIEIFQTLEAQGADCIDLVTPDHVSNLIAEALKKYRPKVPVVYNSGGYCTVEALEEIAPFIDVWMPDLKFCDPALASRYTGRGDYFEYAARAIAYMAKTPPVWEGGKLLRGLLVRHLVMPACSYDSLSVLGFLAKTVPLDTPLSIMRQYTPMGDIAGFPELGRRVTAREYRRVTDYALSLGFTNIFTQGKESAEAAFVPDWDF